MVPYFAVLTVWYSILHGMVSNGMVWYGKLVSNLLSHIESYGTASYGTAWDGVLQHVLWYCTCTAYYMVWYGTIWYGMLC